jgi:hypothetical protein
MTSEEIRMMGKTVMDDGSVKDGINGEWNSDRNHLDQLRTLVAEFKRREEAAA